MESTELNTTSTTVSPGLGEFFETPYFRVIKEIPSSLTFQIEKAVSDFVCTSHIPRGVDAVGFIQQTLSSIANATYLGQGGEFWVGTLKGRLLIYALAHVGNDIDGKLTYTISQTWVVKDYRGKPIVKQWWEAMVDRARHLFCRHLMIVSTRNPKAYERFLKSGLETYAVLMKTDL